VRWNFQVSFFRNRTKPTSRFQRQRQGTSRNVQNCFNNAAWRRRGEHPSHIRRHLCHDAQRKIPLPRVHPDSWPISSTPIRSRGKKHVGSRPTAPVSSGQKRLGDHNLRETWDTPNRSSSGEQGLWQVASSPDRQCPQDEYRRARFFARQPLRDKRRPRPV